MIPKRFGPHLRFGKSDTPRLGRPGIDAGAMLGSLARVVSYTERPAGYWLECEPPCHRCVSLVLPARAMAAWRRHPVIGSQVLGIELTLPRCSDAGHEIAS